MADIGDYHPACARVLDGLFEGLAGLTPLAVTRPLRDLGQPCLELTRGVGGGRCTGDRDLDLELVMRELHLADGPA